MPDRQYPVRWRGILRVTRATLYLALIIAGLFGVVMTPLTIAGTIGEPLTYWWAALLFSGATVAFAGVIMDRYRVEWLALWPAVGGASLYAFTVWTIWLSGEWGRGVQAMLVSGLTIAVTYRALELGAYAAKLRAEHFAKRGARD